MKPTLKNVAIMLRESNAIEGVYGKDSVRTARNAWLFLMKYEKLNNMIVRQAHKMMMSNQGIPHKYMGEWRDVPVWIGGVKKSDPPLVINKKMQEWCIKTNTVDRNFDPVTLHIEFEDIHPFIDGNGRIGRLLLNWHLVKKNKATLLVYTEDDRATYYRLFSHYRNRERVTIFTKIMKDIELMDRHE